MSDIMLLNGPNLNLLGVREPKYYSGESLDNIVSSLEHIAHSHHLTLSHFQHNGESDLISCIHQAYQDKVRFIIINPAGFTHTSIALRDALLAVNIPFVELHLSNIYARENFRHHSYFSDIASGIITGLGIFGYELALRFAIKYISENIASNQK